MRLFIGISQNLFTAGIQRLLLVFQTVLQLFDFLLVMIDLILLFCDGNTAVFQISKERFKVFILLA